MLGFSSRGAATMSYPPAYPPAYRTSSLAVVSMVFGILTWIVLPIIGAIIAIICGHMARSEIRRAPAGTTIEGDGMAVAGLVLGYIHLVLGALAIAAVIFFLMVLGWHSPF
jgi:predicted small integral membrane protein